MILKIDSDVLHTYTPWNLLVNMIPCLDHINRIVVLMFSLCLSWQRSDWSVLLPSWVVILLTTPSQQLKLETCFCSCGICLLFLIMSSNKIGFQ